MVLLFNRRRRRRRRILIGLIPIIYNIYKNNVKLNNIINMFNNQYINNSNFSNIISNNLVISNIDEYTNNIYLQYGINKYESINLNNDLSYELLSNVSGIIKEITINRSDISINDMKVDIYIVRDGSNNYVDTILFNDLSSISKGYYINILNNDKLLFKFDGTGTFDNILFDFIIDIGSSGVEDETGELINNIGSISNVIDNNDSILEDSENIKNALIDFFALSNEDLDNIYFEYMGNLGYYYDNNDLADIKSNKDIVFYGKITSSYNLYSIFSFIDQSLINDLEYSMYILKYDSNNNSIIDMKQVMDVMIYKENNNNVNSLRIYRLVNSNTYSKYSDIYIYDINGNSIIDSSTLISDLLNKSDYLEFSTNIGNYNNLYNMVGVNLMCNIEDYDILVVAIRDPDNCSYFSVKMM